MGRLEQKRLFGESWWSGALPIFDCWSATGERLAVCAGPAGGGAAAARVGARGGGSDSRYHRLSHGDQSQPGHPLALRLDSSPGRGDLHGHSGALLLARPHWVDGSLAWTVICGERTSPPNPLSFGRGGVTPGTIS